MAKRAWQPACCTDSDDGWEDSPLMMAVTPDTDATTVARS
eukprot:CAMPEP_0198125870 /NCGR_PEP_ID=MMETSP1442-20131203/43553_1 /TAXON_ID= /ORGANISM="Craspedostauros australis, Strain CCMP3328" /LENGTH=39 /DNA_ID= /DNA_START= /DNA_END= /DNA_ORIENTATION=